MVRDVPSLSLAPSAPCSAILPSHSSFFSLSEPFFLFSVYLLAEILTIRIILYFIFWGNLFPEDGAISFLGHFMHTQVAVFQRFQGPCSEWPRCTSTPITRHREKSQFSGTQPTRHSLAMTAQIHIT